MTLLLTLVVTLAKDKLDVLYVARVDAVIVDRLWVLWGDNVILPAVLILSDTRDQLRLSTAVCAFPSVFASILPLLSSA